VHTDFCHSTLLRLTRAPDAEWVEKFLKSGELNPREAAIEFSVAGTPEDCITKIDEYIKAGAKHFLLINSGPDPRRVVETYSREIIPGFRQGL
jgi:alkanesulfonate monooxygenase SsuD/methylene tetrahydromethanopterin reductase-like flavin-dependent oxidoreductase (luciferase family)